VIIHNLDLLRPARRPHKTDMKLIIDADAMLSGTFAFKAFQPIARRHAQIIEYCGNRQLAQFTPRDGFDIHEPLHPLPVEQGLRLSAFECFDHWRMVTDCVSIVKRQPTPK